MGGEERLGGGKSKQMDEGSTGGVGGQPAASDLRGSITANTSSDSVVLDDDPRSIDATGRRRKRGTPPPCCVQRRE